jgi:hypothetical protein
VLQLLGVSPADDDVIEENRGREPFHPERDGLAPFLLPEFLGKRLGYVNDYSTNDLKGHEVSISGVAFSSEVGEKIVKEERRAGDMGHSRRKSSARMVPALWASA